MIIDFFKQGGVFFFDENSAISERAYYQIEDLMGEEEGANICEAYVGEDEEFCVYYDSSVLSEEEVIAKFNNGNYVKKF